MIEPEQIPSFVSTDRAFSLRNPNKLEPGGTATLPSARAIKLEYSINKHVADGHRHAH